MKKTSLKLIMTMLAVAVFTGCNSNTVQQPDNNVTLPAPVDGGSGAYQSSISGGGGYINVEYVIQSTNSIDHNSFFITHYVGSDAFEHYFPSSFSNGSLTRVETKVYITPNDTGSPVKHTIEVSYYDFDGQRVVDKYTYTQEPKPAAPVQTVTTSATI